MTISKPIPKLTSLKVTKLGYSSGPWRLVDEAGNEVHWESEECDLPGAPPRLPIVGYPTKVAAQDALLRYGDAVIANLQRKLAEIEPDRVRCRAESSNLTVGKEYEVVLIDGRAAVIDNGGYQRWVSHRLFEFVLPGVLDDARS